MKSLELVEASRWLHRNAAGNCSVLIAVPSASRPTEWGTAVYIFWHDNPAGPMIYGPIGYRDEAGKTRIMYRSLPQVSERRTIL